MRKDKSIAAFPINDGFQTSYGMSLRDYFAGQFIVAILSHQHMIPSGDDELEGFCKMAYRAAEMMIDERNRSDA